jgi:hypothetical protein
MTLVLIPKVLLATLRALDVPHKLFVGTGPQLANVVRLFKMIYGLYKAYCRHLRACWNATRNVRRIGTIRAVTEAFRMWQPVAVVSWNVVRAALRP